MRFGFKLNPLTVRRIKRFRQIRRGWYSLILMGVLFGCSLGSELLINNRALVVRYDGRTFFPAFNHRYYSQQIFGKRADLETDFRELKKDPEFLSRGGFILMPLHPYSPLESLRIPGDPPPSNPSWQHPMGTDDTGRDVLARVVYGFRISVSFALLVTLGSYLIGVTAGAIQGYFGGAVDMIGQRGTEIWSALPFLYVVILISSIITPNFAMLVFVLWLFGWIGISRYTRGEVLRERNRDYVTAARASGAGWPRILAGHVLGNSLTSAITLFPLSMVADIFALTALDFLGYGLPAPTPSWGELFDQGRSNISSWWLIGYPFLALVTTLLLWTFIGEAVREAWDPRVVHARRDEDERPGLVSRLLGRKAKAA
jgi:microcin C transport system permease protein